MKNSLSYKYGTVSTGAEILEWAQYQVDNYTSHQQQGNTILNRYGKTLKPDKRYHIYGSRKTYAVNEIVKKPYIIKTKQFSVRFQKPLDE